jgi:hypothetical protein
MDLCGYKTGDDGGAWKICGKAIQLPDSQRFFETVTLWPHSAWPVDGVWITFDRQPHPQLIHNSFAATF